ncbi:hypothetical protein AMECASPLE_029594, partial [Ameca splendens]
VLSCLHAFLWHMRISFESFKVEHGKTKTRIVVPPFNPLPSSGKEKTNRSHCTVVAGFVSLSVQGGGGWQQADSVNSYHDHNRANEHSSAMKAQRERLRIPGLTLE